MPAPHILPEWLWIPIQAPVTGTSSSGNKAPGSRSPQGWSPPSWGWAAHQLPSGPLLQRQMQTPACSDAGSLAAPTGVAELNDSVTLATRNNNIITVRAIFHLSSLTPELLLGSPARLRSLKLLRAPPHPPASAPRRASSSRSSGQAALAPESQGAAAFISRVFGQERKGRAHQPEHPSNICQHLGYKPSGDLTGIPA